MGLVLILASPAGIAWAVALVLLRARSRRPPHERASGGWAVALFLFLTLDAVLALVFLLSVAVFNCHGRYECPF